MATATQRALENLELLEMILLQLPARDLLLTQRVDKRFQSAIAESIHIQRKLFRQPQAQSKDGMSLLNPFVMHILRHHGIPEKQDRMKPIVEVSDSEGRRLLELKGYMDDVVSDEARLIPTNGSIKFHIVHCDMETMFLPRSVDSIYHNMLIADPPMQIEWANH